MMLTRRMIKKILIVCAIIVMSAVVLTAMAAEKKKDAKPFWAGGKHFQLTGEVVFVDEDEIHDPENPAVKILQQPYDAMMSFPRDSQGIIDWVKVLEQGLIDPRASVDGTGEMFPVDFDIIFKNFICLRLFIFVELPNNIYNIINK